MVVSGTAAGICLLFGGLALRYLILAVGIFEGFFTHTVACSGLI